MNEPITARVALPCILRSPASMEASAGGTTVELTRDLILLRLAPGAAAQSLRPGLAVILDIELPVTDGRSPRYLECATTVRAVQPVGDTVQVSVDVASMNFIGRRTAFGGRGVA